MCTGNEREDDVDATEDSNPLAPMIGIIHGVALGLMLWIILTMITCSVWSCQK